MLWFLAIVIVVAVVASMAAFVVYRAQLDAAHTAAIERVKPNTKLRRLQPARQHRETAGSACLDSAAGAGPLPNWTR